MDLLAEDIARSASSRLDLHHYVAELAVRARLLLVTATLGGRTLDRLAISRLRPARRDADAELPLQPVKRDAEMHFTLARQAELPRCRVGTKGERRILID